AALVAFGAARGSGRAAPWSRAGVPRACGPAWERPGAGAAGRRPLPPAPSPAAEARRPGVRTLRGVARARRPRDHLPLRTGARRAPYTRVLSVPEHFDHRKFTLWALDKLTRYVWGLSLDGEAQVGG